MTLKSDTSNEPEENQIESNDEEPTILIDAVDAVGQISPIILIAGVVIGLLLFIMIAGGLLIFILSGGFGLVADIPDEPVRVDFEIESAAFWQAESKTTRNEAGELYFTQQAIFEDGAYRLYNNVPDQTFWATAGIELAGGSYEVDVTFEQIEEGIGAGLIFLVAEAGESSQFFLFEIDPNGFAWIGRCESACAESTPLTGGGWYPVGAIKTGAKDTNRLKVDVKSAQLIFYINDIEVGKVRNVQMQSWGDVGFLVESSNEGMMSAQFDNFVWTPN